MSSCQFVLKEVKYWYKNREKTKPVEVCNRLDIPMKMFKHNNRYYCAEHLLAVTNPEEV